MFHQIKYLLIELRPQVKVSKILQMNLTPIGIESVATEDKRLVLIDWIDNLLVEFTGRFDKDGQEIYSGDIIELKQEAIDDLLKSTKLVAGDLIPGLYTIGWSQGVFSATHVKEEKGFFLFEEQICMRVSKLGNQFEHVQLILDYLKPAADDKMKGTEGEIEASPEAKQ